MQPHSSPRVRSLGVALLVLTASVAALLLLPALALAAPLGCHPGGDASWVLDEQQVAQPAVNAGAPVVGGSSIFWADDSAGNLDIYGAVPGAGTQTTIAGGSGGQYDPAWGGGLLAYVDDASGAPMIWALHTTGDGTPFAVSSAAGEHPATDGSFIVWSTPDTSGQADVMGYDVSTGTEFTICDAAGAQTDPAVSDGVVVWQDDRNGNWDIYGYDIASKTVFPVCTADGDQTNPDVYCGLAVWQDDRNCDWDIYGVRIADRLSAGLVRGHLVRGQLVREARLGDLLGCHDGEFAVCTAEGDQTDPSIAGPLIAWTDARCDPGQSDIYAYDLEDQTEFVVCDAAGSQSHVDLSGDGTIAWLDGRDGGQYPAIYTANWVPGGDANNPAPTTEWTSDSLITLFLSVFDQMGVFSEFRVSFNGGATWSDWQPFSGIDQLQLPCGDGAKTISLQFEDADGNQTPVVSVTVHLDTHGPVTAAPLASHARVGERVLIRFRVRDALSPKATVTLRVRTHAGKLLRTVRLGQRPTNRLLGIRIARLHRGSYRFSVYATDLAGNHQARIGSNRLVVR